jgi:hypothetical protein
MPTIGPITGDRSLNWIKGGSGFAIPPISDYSGLGAGGPDRASGLPP